MASSSTGAVGPLLIRARLSTHDDTDSDISPVYSHDDNSYGSTASDSDPDSHPYPHSGGFGDNAVTIDTASSAGFGRGIAIPVAKISGDEDDEGLDEEEDDGERNWGFGGGEVARVVSNERELNSIDYDHDHYGRSDYGYLEGTDDIAGSSEGNNDSNNSSVTKNEVQDEKPDSEVTPESFGLQSYSLEEDMYDINGTKEAKFEPDFDVDGENNGAKYANHKLIGGENGDAREYRLSKDKGKGTFTADGIYFDEATTTDNESSSITTVNFDEEKLHENENDDDTVEFDHAALQALIRQATISITSEEHLEEENQADDESLATSCDGFLNLLTEEGKKVHEMINSVRVKFIRLVNRLGLSIEENKTASELLNRLTVAESLKLKTWLDDAKILEKAKRDALFDNDEGNDMKFSCTILVIGKTGVGKSALINSIFRNEMCPTDAFHNGTNRINEIFGVIDGVDLRVIDTPGLRTSIMDQGINRKLLSSIKRHLKKHTPDVVLYVDRVDSQTQISNDMPMLTSITEVLGISVWQKVVRVLTHAGSHPPEGPSGAQLKYETYITQQVHLTQRVIQMVARDAALSNPVALVENRASCGVDPSGERLLPNGIPWRPNLLLLCYSFRIMSEVYPVLKPDDFALLSDNNNNEFGYGMFRLPLQFFLSSLLRSRPHMKLINGNVRSDDEIEELYDSDLEKGEDDDEYDTLPPFRPLNKTEIEKLSREEKRVYFDEYKYRIKLFESKQLRAAKEMKGVDKKNAEKYVHMNDLALPPSFDGDCPSYLYRFSESNDSWARVRAMSDAHGWDHDCGLNGVILENSPVIMGVLPTSTWVQLKKNKEEFMIHIDSSICAKHHGELGSTLTNLEIQKFGNCTACIINNETRLKNLISSFTTAAGISVAFSGNMVSTGFKIANQAHVFKNVILNGTAGTVHGKDGTIYGCDLEAEIRSKEYPIGLSRSFIELNLVKLKDVLSMGGSFKTQFEVSSGLKLAVNLGIDGNRNGHFGVNIKSSEHTQIAVLGLISLGAAIFNRLRTNPSAGGEILQ